MDKNILFGTLAFVVVIALIAFFVIRGLRPGIRPSTPTSPAPIEKKIVTASDIMSDPLVYDNLEVEIDAQINDWVTEKAFTVAAGSSGTLGAGPRRLMIISPSAFKLPEDTLGKEVGLGEEIEVKITGRVVILNADQLSQALGIDIKSPEVELDDNRSLKSWRLGPTILADTVERK